MDGLDEVRKRLVGKTVAAVEKAAGYTECICRVKLEDGSSFRLHATELGSWIEDDVNGDGSYPSLKALSQACAAYRYQRSPEHGFDLPSAKARIEDGKLVLDAFDGTAFWMRLDGMTEDERKVADHPRGASLLEHLADGMEFWHNLFRPDREECPKELRSLFQHE